MKYKDLSEKLDKMKNNKKKRISRKYNNLYVSKRLRKDRMTFIIGMRYSGGIVLIGDTKVVEGHKYFHSKKIETPLENVKICVGSAGLTALSREFNRKLKEIVNQRIREKEMANIREIHNSPILLKDVQEGKVELPQVHVYNAHNLLDDCALLTKQLAETGKIYNQNPIESIVAINVGEPSLYAIDCNGFKIEVPCISIGSGTDHIGEYLKRNHDENMGLEEAIFLGTFLIKYVEMLELDNMVGVEEGKMPQIFLVNDEFFGNFDLEKNDRKRILKNVIEKVKIIKEQMIIFPDNYEKNKKNSMMGENKGKII